MKQKWEAATIFQFKTNILTEALNQLWFVFCKEIRSCSLVNFIRSLVPLDKTIQVFLVPTYEFSFITSKQSCLIVKRVFEMNFPHPRWRVKLKQEDSRAKISNQLNSSHNLNVLLCLFTSKPFTNTSLGIHPKSNIWLLKESIQVSFYTSSLYSCVEAIY